MTRVLFHVDMDAFYASVEQRDDPDLRGRPVIVGGAPQSRGVVAACSYEARAFGIHSAMPCAQAARLCPSAYFVRPRMAHYREIAQAIRALFREYTERMEPMSIDEAYLELTPTHPDPDRALTNALPLAESLRHEMTTRLGLTCSVGVASNKFLAKMASGFQKPDGLTLIPETDKAAFLAPLAVERIHGVGPATARTLNNAGIRTIGDLQNRGEGVLPGCSAASSARLRELAFGLDPRPVQMDDEVKSVSAETTFPQDISDRGRLRDAILELSKDVATRLARRTLRAHTVHVKVRYPDFTTITRQCALDQGIEKWDEIYVHACHLVRTRKLLRQPLRLIGLGVSHLESSEIGQLWLPFDPPNPHNPGGNFRDNS